MTVDDLFFLQDSSWHASFPDSSTSTRKISSTEISSQRTLSSMSRVSLQRLLIQLSLTCYLRLSIGYVRITDFGIARVWREENAQDTSGTPGYMAPEVMCRQNHTTSVDFFAVGVMAFECMFGRVSHSISGPASVWTHVLFHSNSKR